MFEKWSDRIEEGLLALLLGGMTMLTFVQVVLRYVFNSGFTWALEATTYLFGWMVMLGMSYGVRKGSHIGVDVIVQQFPPATRRAIGIAAALLSMLYAGILLYGGYNYVDTMHTLGVEAEDIPIERWILLLAVPLGFALLLWRPMEATYLLLIGREGGFRLADEAADAVEQFHDIDKNEPGRTP
jgi:C4-dicarboxylate transporter, DctQ subunit